MEISDFEKEQGYEHYDFCRIIKWVAPGNFCNFQDYLRHFLTQDRNSSDRDAATRTDTIR